MANIRDKEISDKAIFFVIWIMCGILLLFSLVNLRRGCQVYPEFEATMQRYTQLRWLTFFNCLLQLECFVGYYLNYPLFTETAWVIWVTTASFCLSTLSVRTSQACFDLCQIEEEPQNFRRSTKSDRNCLTIFCFCCISHSNKTKDNLIVVLIYIFWILSAFFNIFGSIAAWKYKAMALQFGSFGMWRLLSAISLIFTVYRLMRVRRLSINCLSRLEEDQYPQTKLETVIASIKIMKTLTFFIFLLIIALLISSYMDIESFINYLLKYHDLDSNEENYTSDIGTQNIETLIIAAMYFPLWTFVQIICLVYCWVPQRYLWSAFENLTYSALNPGSSGYF